MSPDERQKHRMAEMKPVMDAYWDFLSSFSSEKDSNLQKAQTYSLHQRKQLEAVLLDRRLELTNNILTITNYIFNFFAIQPQYFICVACYSPQSAKQNFE